MRQQQQRSRNRNRGRKSSNPLSRNFESNGPDVKIRGNANHIAEKYSVLARDALTSGDTVMAENYFQHAEHYFRIVAAANLNNAQSATHNNSQRENPQHDSGGEGGNSQAKDASSNRSGETQKDSHGDGPQPNLEEVPAEVVLKEENSPVSEVRSNKSADETDTEENDRTRRNGRRPSSNRRTARVATKKDKQASSSDGASLPSSLIGKSDESESESESATAASDE